MTRSSVPPGTRSKLLTTSRVLLDPFRWLPRWREQYGDPFTLSAMNGTIVMTGEPEGIQQIFGGPHEGFDVSPPRRRRRWWGAPRSC